MNMLKIFLVVLSVMIVGCGRSTPYDDGYQDALEGKKDPTRYKVNVDYRSGHNDASYQYYYDMGSHDAEIGEFPRFPDREDYMEGYKGE